MAGSVTKFNVKAITRNGEARTLDIEASSEDAAVLALLQAGLTPVSISAQGQTWLDRLNRPVHFNTGVSLTDLALFAEQLAEMLSAGLTVEQALTVFGKQRQRGSVAELVQRLLRRVCEGSPLSRALEAERNLPRYLIGIVRAAEQGGRMSEGLADAARYLQRQLAARRGLMSALAYPAVVLVTVVVALGFILGFVIPEFAPIFAGEEHRLPRMTRLVLALSQGVTHPDIRWLFLPVTALALLVGILTGFPAARAALAGMIWKLPFVRLVGCLDIAKALGVMGALIDNGIEVSEAVRLAAQAASSRRVQQALTRAAQDLREGASISATLTKIEMIPEITLSIIEVGEHTGALGRASLRAAQLLETDTTFKIDRFIALVNPLAIAGLGLLVGFVITGVMLGIMSINQLATR